MLASGHGGTSLIVCSTCRGAGRAGPPGRVGGRSDDSGSGPKHAAGDTDSERGPSAPVDVGSGRANPAGAFTDRFRPSATGREGRLYRSADGDGDDDGAGRHRVVTPGISPPVAAGSTDTAGSSAPHRTAERSSTAALAGPDPDAATSTTGENRDAAAAGTDLLAAIRSVAADARYAAIAVETMACFWSCAAGISVHLRAAGKIGYVLGRFGADAEVARALLDLALAYDATSDGEIPFECWPAGVLGHFIVRVPPSGRLIG